MPRTTIPRQEKGASKRLEVSRLRSAGFGCVYKRSAPDYNCIDRLLVCDSPFFPSPGRFLSGSSKSTRRSARLPARGHFERHGRALFVARAYLRHTERVVVGPPSVPKPQTHLPLVRSSRCPPRASLRRLPSAPLPPPVARVRPCARAPPPSKVRSLSRRRRASECPTRAKASAPDGARLRARRRARRADPRLRSRRDPSRDSPFFREPRKTDPKKTAVARPSPRRALHRVLPAPRRY